jgi:uncharacterized membrane protein (DUF485 family)
LTVHTVLIFIIFKIYIIIFESGERGWSILAQRELISRRKASVDYVKVTSSSQFKQFLSRKNKFIVPMTVFFMIFYFLLPIFTSYTTFLNNPAMGDISWTWIFAFSQFVMVWVISAIYVKKAASYDKEAEQIINEQLK